MPISAFLESIMTMRLFEFSSALSDGDPQETRAEWKMCLYEMKPRFSRSSLPKTSTRVVLANCHVNQKREREAMRLLATTSAQVLVPE